MREMGSAEVSRILRRFAKERPGFPQARQPLAAYQNFRRFILVDEIEGVTIITIRRPQAMNALNDELTDEILSVLEQYADDPAVKGFVITGYGNAAFSAGADIGKFPQMLGKAKASAQYARDCAKVQTFMDRIEKAGGGGRQRLRHGRRSGDCHPLPPDRGHAQRPLAVSGNHLGHPAGHRRLRGRPTAAGPRPARFSMR